MIAVQKLFWRFGSDDAPQLPSQVICVLNARVCAARTKWGHLMRAVTSKDHAVMAKFLNAAALERVDRAPDQLIVDFWAQHRVQPFADLAVFEFFLAVHIPTDLKIDPPHVIGLFVQQGRGAGFEVWLEPEPALCGEVGRHADVGDQKAVFENTSGEIGANHLAQRRRGPIAGQKPVGLKAVGAVGRADLHDDVIITLLYPINPVPSTQLNRRALSACLRNAIDDSFFKIGLLQIDKCRTAVAVFGLKIKLKNLMVIVKHLAQVPCHTRVDQRLAKAMALSDFKCAFGKTYRLRALSNAFMVIQQNHGDSLQSKIQCHGQPDRPGPDNHRGVTHRVLCVLIGSPFIGIKSKRQIVTVLQHQLVVSCEACKAAHISLSRWAVQTRGVSIPRASSKARATLKGRQCS